MASGARGHSSASRSKSGTSSLKARSGAELVGLAELFYRWAFTGALIAVALAAFAALALLPFRRSVSAVDAYTPTVLLTGLLVVAAPIAARWPERLFRLLRRHAAAEAAPVALAAALLAYPLRSELWWPAAALLILVGVLVPVGRALMYCLVVLCVNLAAHALAGDLDDVEPVAILGLWIGLPFWAAASALVTDSVAAYLLNAARRAPPSPPSAAAFAASAPRPDPGPGAPTTFESRLALRPTADRHQNVEPPPKDAVEVPDRADPARLTPRQLEVVALLADGLRYVEIGSCLCISTRQVQKHVAAAVSRLGARNANELVALVVAQGLVPSRATGQSPRAGGETSEE
ncbi:MAG: helix-turn-helix transcriptional regulator [Actinomycetota bacterium]|nr:helix-turn-helix transcriptional regulator [Actinomycetota bacterium]